MILRTGNLPRLWLLSHRTSRARLTELLAGCRAECKRLAAENAMQAGVLESERQWRLRSLPELLAAAGEVERLTLRLEESIAFGDNAAAENRRLRGYVEIVRASKAAPGEGGRP